MQCQDCGETLYEDSNAVYYPWLQIWLCSKCDGLQNDSLPADQLEEEYERP